MKSLANTQWYGEFEGYGYTVIFTSDTDVTMADSSGTSDPLNMQYSYSHDTHTGTLDSGASIITFVVSPDYETLFLYGAEGVIVASRL